MDEPANPMMSNPSVTSAVFTAGIIVNPSTESISVYKNGSFINITLTMTVPFTCAAHVNPHDCHLTVQIVQPDDDHSQPLAISQCQLSMESSDLQGSQYFLAVPVADFVKTDARKSDTIIQLVVTSYGDAWWHGYQLPNITVKVKCLKNVDKLVFFLWLTFLTFYYFRYSTPRPFNVMLSHKGT